MALNLPDNASAVISRVHSDITTFIDSSNPFLEQGWFGAFATALGNRAFDFYYLLKKLEIESIPDTAIVNAPRWGTIYGVPRAQQGPSTGHIAVTGASGRILSSGTAFTDVDGRIFRTTQTVAVPNSTTALVSLTNVGIVATATTYGPHYLANEIRMNITSSDKAPYNVSDQPIRVLSDTEFEYDMVSDPGGNDSGNARWRTISVGAPIESVSYGSDKNKLFDEQLPFVSTPFFFFSPAYVTWDGLTGGTDDEGIESLKDRYLERIRNPIAHFNANEIIFESKKVQGVTRVWVREAHPVPGVVTIHFVRDNDLKDHDTDWDYAIPNNNEIEEVALQIYGDVTEENPGIVPANTLVTDGTHDPSQSQADGDVWILKLGTEVIAFEFSSITPDTQGIKDAVEGNLQQWFSESVNPGEDITEQGVTEIIMNSIDIATGDKVASFTLTTPASFPVSVAGAGAAGVADDIAVYGGVTWP